MSLERMTLNKGDAVFIQGNVDDKMYKIVEGKIGIFNAKEIKEEEKLSELENPVMFGELALIHQLPRAASAFALEDNTVLEIIRKDDYEKVISNPDDARMIIDRLSNLVHKISLDYMEACQKIVELDAAGHTKHADSTMQKFIARCKEITATVDRLQDDRLKK